jgi:cathepsin L
MTTSTLIALVFSSVCPQVYALTRAFLANEGGVSHARAKDTRAALDFGAFIKEHERGYQLGSPEYNLRKVIYDRRVEAILHHNSNPNRLWTAGVNHLADATDEEFQARLGWRHHPSKGSDLSSSRVASLLEVTPPTSFSWMNLSLARDVKDQGPCGSCWAVATAATLELNYEATYGKPRSFSAQELVDCVSNPLKCGGKGGCDGATVELALDWVKYNGLKTLKDSPYQAMETECKSAPFRTTAEEQGKLDADGRLVEFFQPGSTSFVSNQGGLAFGLTGFSTLPSNKYLPLIDALMKGPVAATVAASSWQMYDSGILDDCDPTVNHAVVLIGFGEDHRLGKKYWHIRNSWGPYWGEDGFLRLLRTDDEEQACGMDKRPLDGVSCEGGPKEVRVCGSCGILYDNVVPHFASGVGEAQEQNTF